MKKYHIYITALLIAITTMQGNIYGQAKTSKGKNTIYECLKEVAHNAAIKIAVSIHNVFRKKAIDLQLHKKNKHTYAWCKEKSNEHATTLLKKLLQILEIDKETWEKIKEDTDKKTDTISYKHLTSKKPFPQKIKKAISAVLEDNALKKKVEIINIVNKACKIIVETNNNNFEIVRAQKKAGTITLPSGQEATRYMFVKKNVIYIVPEHVTSELELETAIRHEIAHMICKHALKQKCLLNILKKVDKEKYKKLLQAYKKSCEIEADIVSIFDNAQWAKLLETYFKKYGDYKADYYDKTHPTSHQRANYAKEIKRAMYKEKNIKDNDRDYQHLKVVMYTCAFACIYFYLFS